MGMNIVCKPHCGECPGRGQTCDHPEERRARAQHMYVDGVHPETIAETMHIKKKTLAKWIDEWEV